MTLLAALRSHTTMARAAGARRADQPARGGVSGLGPALREPAPDDAARRAAREELGVEIDLDERLGIHAPTPGLRAM